jgi:GABA(A) receptor-associated protein
MMKSFVNDVNDAIVSNLNPLIGPSDPVKSMYTKTEADRVLTKYPDRIPIIVNRSKSACADTPEIDKNKFLVPSDLTVGQFIYVIRKRLALPPHKALFIFVDKTVPPTSMLISTIYEQYKDYRTNFLFVTYSGESTFG